MNTPTTAPVLELSGISKSFLGVRALHEAGLRLYPGEVQKSGPPKGKLRLMYEGNPMAMVIEQAGGAATDGKQSIIDVECNDIHQRTPLVIGSKDDVEEYLSFCK